MPLFDSITYHLSETLTPSTHARVASLLSLNGATPSSVDEATHIVSNSAQFEGWEKAKGVVATVSPLHMSYLRVLKCHMCVGGMGDTLDGAGETAAVCSSFEFRI